MLTLDYFIVLKEFHRIGKSKRIDYHILHRVVAARYIRFHPIKEEDWNCLRTEVYGAKGIGIN